MEDKMHGFFNHESDELALTRYAAQPNSPLRTLISLHGAGPAGRERVDYLCSHLQKTGVSSFTFDFTGHGESSGKLSESSLAKRSCEARQAILTSGFGSPDIFVGTSMGAFVALTLLEEYKPSHLLLFCPAIYGDEALDIPFDQRFTAAIRKPGSYEGSRYLKSLQDFEGKTMILIGTEDKIIPRRVIEIYEEARAGRSHQTIWLEGAEHVIHRWVLKENSRKKFLLDLIDTFINS